MGGRLEAADAEPCCLCSRKQRSAALRNTAVTEQWPVLEGRDPPGEQQPPLHQKRFSCVLGAGLQLREGLALSFPSMWWFGSPKCQSRSCPLLEFSSGVIHPQQRPCVRSEITCQARESLRNTFSLWFSCAAPSQSMQVQRERTNRVQKIVLLFGSLLLGFFG